MSCFLKCICIVLLALFFSPSVNGQCPDDPKDLVLNTQEKFDFMTKNFPSCNKFEIYMVNGKFIGEPKPINYLASLFLIMAGILILLKLIIVKLNLE